MTEADWLSCTNPYEMLRWLSGRKRPSERKARLFAAACARAVEHLLQEERHRRAIAVAERLADGEATEEERERAHQRTHRKTNSSDWKAFATVWSVSAGGEQIWSAADNACGNACLALDRLREGGPAAARFASLLRCIFGGPARPAGLCGARHRRGGPNCAACRLIRAANDGAAARLAQTAYAERNFAELPVLADALEDAGCAGAELLAHLRGPGPHTRGCWALDLVLAKP
jgi:hypothetical protein